MQGVVGTEDTSPAQPAAAEAEAAASFQAVGLFTENEGDICEEETMQPKAAQVLYARLEKLSEARIEGWVWDPLESDKRLRLELVDGGDPLSVVVADIYRADLVQMGCGDGRHGFRIDLDAGSLLEGSHLFNLRCADTRATTLGSPIVIKRRNPGATRSPSTARSDTRLIVRGQIDKVPDTAILGWVMMPNRP
jgi:hypothetical protein